MSCDPIERPVAELTDRDASWEECCELIEELAGAEDDGTCSLKGFARLLMQLITIDQQHASVELNEFIEEAMNEIRRLVAAGDNESPRLDSLQHDAVERWSHLLEIDDAGDPDSFAEASDWESDLDDAPTSTELDLVSPSAAEIHSIIQQVTNTVPVEHSAGKLEAFENETLTDDVQTESAHDVISSLDAELREAFLDDATGGISRMEAALLNLENDPDDREPRVQICRELHSLKGASASVGLSLLADELHQLEERLREDQQSSQQIDVESLLRAVDSIRSQIFGSTPCGDAVDKPSSIGTKSSEIATEEKSPRVTDTRVNPTIVAEDSHDEESVRVNAAKLNRLMDMLAELVMLRNDRENEVAALTEMYHELFASVSKMRLLGDDVHEQTATTTSLQMSEVANDVLEVAQTVRDCARPIAEGNAAVSHFIRQFRQELVELKRTPVAGLFRRLQRVVRDAARTEGKKVDLKLIGIDAGIDRSLQQRLYEPLLHILRNSVCHGIEPPEQRAQAGKPSTGMISLEAQSGPDLFVIEIRDDGRGLDFDAIRRRGIESGLLRPGQLATRDELSNLIFQPGFSTRTSVNQAAGRGVGMDVVASTLQRMRGWIEVDSQAQQGTCIRLGIPLPSVIQHAMVFRAGTQLFALPMQSVSDAGGEFGDSVALRFSDLVGDTQSTASAPSHRITLAGAAANESSGRVEPIALLVDQVIGPEELVVRPLPSLLRHHPICCGATLSSAGQTVLLLDSHQINQRCRTLSDTCHVGLDRPSDERPSEDGEPDVRVLVVDDSLSARRRVVRSLRRYHVQTVEAGDGREALRILNKEQFAAVFSDMEMPHVDGMELLAGIQGLPESRRPAVVIISSRTEDDFLHRASELGAHAYLQKPLDDEALDGAIQGMPGFSKLRTNSDTNPDRGATT